MSYGDIGGYENPGVPQYGASESDPEGGYEVVEGYYEDAGQPYDDELLVSDLGADGELTEVNEIAAEFTRRTTNKLFPRGRG